MNDSTDVTYAEDAILFALWLPSPDKAQVIEAWFTSMLKHGYGDCDLFIGLNPSPCQQIAIQICEKYRSQFHHLEVSVVPNIQVVNSDVSGYQRAMQLLHVYRPSSSYQLVWFLHSKGMSYGAADCITNINITISTIMSKRQYATKKLLDDAKAGTWSHVITIQDSQTYMKSKDWSVFYDGFKFPSLCMYHVYTYLVMKGQPLHNFLNKCNPRFFTCNLPVECGLASRWFCEVFLGDLAWRQGYYPLFETILPLHTNPCAPTRSNIQAMIALHQNGSDPREFYHQPPKVIARIKFPANAALSSRLTAVTSQPRAPTAIKAAVPPPIAVVRPIPATVHKTPLWHERFPQRGKLRSSPPAHAQTTAIRPVAQPISNIPVIHHPAAVTSTGTKSGRQLLELRGLHARASIHEPLQEPPQAILPSPLAHVFYHVFADQKRNHIRIIDEQLQTVMTSKLLDTTAIFHCGIAGPLAVDAADRIRSVFERNEYSAKLDIFIVAPLDRSYERLTMHHLHKLATEMKDPDTPIMYFHSKGVKFDAHNPLNNSVTQWRQMMAYFIIEQHIRCKEILMSRQPGYDILGSLLRPKPWLHFSGTFWWAKAGYIAKLKTPIPPEYFGPEYWALTGINVRAFSLHNTPHDHYYYPYPRRLYAHCVV